MSLIDTAVQHFESIGRQKMVVPEWGNAVITWLPLTVLQQKALLGGKDPGPELKVDTIILKAENEQGAKLFSEMDKHKLMSKVAPKIIDRIASRILDTPDVDATEKN